jgi:hypothetical protein
MTDSRALNRCLDEEKLLSFVDADLPPEQLERIERHVASCGSCAERVESLRTLIVDLGAKVPAADLDVDKHVASVMRRLDTAPVSVHKPRWSVAAGFAIAASVGALWLASERSHEAEPGQLAARGSDTESSLARDVGLELLRQGPRLEKLVPGSQLEANTAFTAGHWNLSEKTAYLLLFAVDSERVVHWIAPSFTTLGSDPASIGIGTSKDRRLLGSSAVFDDLAVGPLRVIALITKEPLRVSAVESLPAAELEPEALGQRFPKADLRVFPFSIVREAR